MKTEDELDAEIASMFDEVKEVRVETVNGKLRVQTTDTDFVKACKRFVVAYKTFCYWDRKPDKYAEGVQMLWWDALAELSDTERIVKRGFIGDRPTPESNIQYAKWRADYLEGKNIKVDT